MKAVVLEKRGRDGIRIGDFPDPERPAGNAIMRVRAAALNHVDLYMRDVGKGIRHELPMVLGLDAGGEIVEADPDSGLTAGQRVLPFISEFCGTCEACLAGEQPFCDRIRILGEQRHGTYAEYLSMKAHNFVPIPDNYDYREAAGLGAAYMTAWRMVFGKTRLIAGETVLINGIGGGVAVACLQFAKLAGARVIVTSSSDEKLARAVALGADETINYRNETVWQRVRELTNGRGADVVFDNAGADAWDGTLRSAGKGGRIVVCGATTGGHPPADLQRIFVRQLHIYGSTTCSMKEFRDMLAAAAQGAFKPVIDSIHAMDDYETALARLERGEQFGKIILDVD